MFETDERIVYLKMPSASARANSALFILLIVATLFPVSVGRLLGLIFADTDRFAGHVARVVMERPKLLFARFFWFGSLLSAMESFEFIR
jgi:hypothetical protein